MHEKHWVDFAGCYLKSEFNLMQIQIKVLICINVLIGNGSGLTEIKGTVGDPAECC